MNKVVQNWNNIVYIIQYWFQLSINIFNKYFQMIGIIMRYYLLSNVNKKTK